ncbi:hypothetical protein KCU91_g124, partial [Aureobasidium melanogenum]
MVDIARLDSASTSFVLPHWPLYYDGGVTGSLGRRFQVVGLCLNVDRSCNGDVQVDTQLGCIGRPLVGWSHMLYEFMFSCSPFPV